MTKAQVKAFLRAWNGAIRDKLLDPEHPALTAERLEQLREFARLDEPATIPAVEVSSDQGAEYLRAEQFLVGELATPVPDPTFLTGPHPWQWAALEPDDLPSSTGTNPPIVDPDRIVAALAALLLRSYGLTDPMLVVMSEGGDLPIRLHLSAATSFAELEHQARSKRIAAEHHRRYAALIMTNAIRLAYLGAHATAVRAAIRVRSTAPAPDEDGAPSTRLRELARDLGVAVDVWPSASRVPCLRVGSRFGHRHTAELASALARLLESAWADPAQSVGELPLGDDSMSPRDDAEAMFQFDRDSSH